MDISDSQSFSGIPSPLQAEAQLMHTELAEAARSNFPRLVSVLEGHEGILPSLELLDLSILAPAPEQEIREAMVYLSNRCKELRRIDASGLSLELGNWTYFCALFPRTAPHLREVILRDTNVLSIYLYYFTDRLPELELLDLRGAYRLESFYVKRKGVTVLLSEAPPSIPFPTIS